MFFANPQRPGFQPPNIDQRLGLQAVNVIYHRLESQAPLPDIGIRDNHDLLLRLTLIA